MSQNTFKFEGKNGRCMTAHFTNEELYVLIDGEMKYYPSVLAAELTKEWKQRVTYRRIDDGIEVTDMDVAAGRDRAAFASGCSPMDRMLVESYDHIVEFSIGSDGTKKISKVVMKRDDMMVKGIDNEGKEEDEELLPNEEDALAHVESSFSEYDNSENEEGEEDEEEVFCPNSVYDIVFWVDTNEYGTKVERNAPLYPAYPLHKSMTQDAKNIQTAIQVGSIKTGRQLYLACKNLPKGDVSRLWDAFKLQQYKNKNQK